jgi:receptor protein-tyrosine kinase
LNGADKVNVANGNDNVTVEQTLRVLRRRWPLVLVCVAVVAAAAVGFSLAQRKAYTASASLLFRDPGFDQKLFGTSYFVPNTDPTREAATNIDLASLPTIASRTAAELNLSAGRVRSEVSVSGVGQANVAQIEATDQSPALAARMANAYAHQYVLYRQQADRAKIAGAQRLVQEQLAHLNTPQRYGAVGQSLLNRGNQLGVLAALQTGNAEVAQAAGVPTSPTSPQTKRNGVLGGLLGLLVGLALAFGAERFDRRVRDAAELEEAYGVPVLGAVPDSESYAAAGTKALPTSDAEAFALLRARLRYFNVDRDVQSLLVTSAFPGDGKTTVALNLALAEAVAGNAKIVLLEADLRRPALARRLGIRQTPGLAEILSRNATLDSALHVVPAPGRPHRNGSTTAFSIITAGAIPPNPAELIESRAMIDLLSALTERFDLVIIDSPPTSVVSDAIPLMRLVSGVVIVSRIGLTTRDAARHLREQLTKLKASTLGVVANAMPAKGRGYYGYGYYRDGYEIDGAPELAPEASNGALPRPEAAKSGRPSSS